MATSDPMSCITKLFAGTGHRFTLYHPRGLAHTAPLTIFGYHCLANLKANIVYKVSTLLSQVNKKILMCGAFVNVCVYIYIYFILEIT